MLIYLSFMERDKRTLWRPDQEWNRTE